jgi:hypothetical protein
MIILHDDAGPVVNPRAHPLNTEFKWQDPKPPFNIISTEQAE